MGWKDRLTDQWLDRWTKPGVESRYSHSIRSKINMMKIESKKVHMNDKSHEYDENPIESLKSW